MILHDELYILLNGSRRKIEIPNPSGISLKFQSNMFNDLSKFCASYSYTFQIPKTRNNMEAFDLVEEIRHSSSAYGKKMACEFYRDGIKLFDNSYLYINEVGDTYSAVMTWNVLSWLLQISEDGRSIKDIEKNLGGSQLTSVEWGADGYEITNAQSMDNPSVSGLYRCGTPFIAPNSPNLVPVRYLLNRIARYYGLEDATKIFSFVRDVALTNSDFAGATETFNIADDGVIPLVSGKWSNAYLQTQIQRSDKLSCEQYSTNYPVIDPEHGEIGSPVQASGILCYNGRNQYVRFGDMTGAKDYVHLYRQLGSATNNRQSEGADSTDWSISTSNQNGLYIGFAPVNTNGSIVLRGRIRMADYCNVRIVPFARVGGNPNRFAPRFDDNGQIENAIEIQCDAVEGSENLFEVNFDPEEGGKEIEIKSDPEVEFWAIQIDNNTEVFIADGYLKFVPKRDNISFYGEQPLALNRVDLFNNLPDIKIIDLLKSLFYIENTYPFLEKDGRIGQMRYEGLYDHIEAGNVYDWSNLLIGESRDDSVKYTNGNLGRVNRFNMKNYSASRESDKETSLQYEDATAYFKTENETLTPDNTIFTFPFASAAKVTKNGFSAGDTFIFWEQDDDNISFKPAGSVEPIIGRVRSYNDARYWEVGTSPLSVNRLLKFDIWQVAGKEYDQTILSKIMKKPYVITTKILLDTFTLATLDFTKPVYLHRYNSFFAIVSLQCDTKGVCKAELIKLPNISADEGLREDPVISISGSPVVYKRSGVGAMALYEISASVKGSRINRMVVKVDNQQIADADIEHLRLSRLYESGRHVVEVTAYALDGRSKTEYFETMVKFASGNTTIEFLEYGNTLFIGRSKPNVARFTAVLYNATGSGTMTIYKNERGVEQRTLMASGRVDRISFDWEYFEQLSEGTTPRDWVITAAYLPDGGGETTINSKDVRVQVDRNMLKYYDGDVSGQYFIVGNYYREGSNIENVFQYGDFSNSFVVTGAQIEPYYVEFHFVCYRGSVPSYEYIDRVDPYQGAIDFVTLKKAEYEQYDMIRVYAVARYYDRGSTIFQSDDIWLYKGQKL